MSEKKQFDARLVVVTGMIIASAILLLGMEFLESVIA